MATRWRAAGGALATRHASEEGKTMGIVCGIDFSDNAVQAARVAAALARRLSVPLELVHVIDELGAELTFQGEGAAVYEPLRRQARELSAAIGREFGIEARPSVLPGVAHEALIEIASSSGARLLVLAAAGAGQTQRWLLGSTAERVAQSSPLPVLLVRDAARMEAWAGGSRALRVMVGVELAATSRAALAWAAGLREIGPCDLRVAHVVWPAAEQTRKGVAGGGPPEALDSGLHDLLMRDLMAWAGDLPAGGETTFEVVPAAQRADAQLVAMASDADVDLLVVGRRRLPSSSRLWQGFVSGRVLRRSTSNVACVPRSDRTHVEESIPVYRRVLVPTDFSEEANRAIGVGYGLVAPGGGVCLLHVVAAGPRPPELDPERRLMGLVPRGAATKGIFTEYEVVREQDIGEGICHVAERLGVDAICMATRGRSAVTTLALGSTAQDVLRRARQPVVLVPPERKG